MSPSVPNVMSPPSLATLRVLIVDDEPLARDCMRLALSDAAGVAIVAECGDGASAVDAIRRHSPDVVFLDVQMPGGDGFHVVQSVGPDRMPVVVFVTARRTDEVPATPSSIRAHRRRYHPCQWQRARQGYPAPLR